MLLGERKDDPMLWCHAPIYKTFDPVAQNNKNGISGNMSGKFAPFLVINKI